MISNLSPTFCNCLLLLRSGFSYHTIFGLSPTCPHLPLICLRVHSGSQWIPTIVWHAHLFPTCLPVHAPSAWLQSIGGSALAPCCSCRDCSLLASCHLCVPDSVVCSHIGGSAVALAAIVASACCLSFVCSRLPIVASARPLSFVSPWHCDLQSVGPAVALCCSCRGCRLRSPVLICVSLTLRFAGGSAFALAAYHAHIIHAHIIHINITQIHVTHANITHSISLTRTIPTQYHSRKYRPWSQTLISSHTQSHSIHSTHLTHLTLPHTHISSHSMSFPFTSIHLYYSVQSPTHTLPSTLAYSFVDSQFGITSFVGLSGPLIASNIGSN